jgi:hypothetical protein
MTRITFQRTNTMKKIIMGAMLLLGVLTVTVAQNKRTIYQTFETDSAKTILLDLVGFTDIEIIGWAGNTVLTEVTVQLWDASPTILDHFVDLGRYKFEFKRDGETASITTQTRERKVIKTKISGPNGCLELSAVKIFVPDNYDWTAELEGESDGTVTESKPGLLKWRSGFAGNAEEESREDRNKHKLQKTLTIKPSE